MGPPDVATIHALRSDLALQIARCVARRGLSQLATAKSLDIPQPTLSKIINGKVSELSLELLIRIAVRAGLPVVLHTGTAPEEAGVHVSGLSGGSVPEHAGTRSRLAEEARESLVESVRQLSLEQRLEAFVKHNELIAGLHRVGQLAGAARVRKTGRVRQRSSG